MKRKTGTNFLLALLCALLPLLVTSCSREDDVLEIFTGRTWKLSYIAAEGSYKMYDYWGSTNSTAYKNSMNYLAQDNTFIVDFSGTGDDNSVSGSFSGTVITATITGQWQANAQDRTITTSSVRSSKQETDVLARAFITGLTNAIRYEGDTSNLFIYYQDGQTVKRMGFVPN